MHTHHLGGDHVIENMETYWAQVTYGNILGTSYIRYFSTISLIPSCFPNTSDVKREKEGDVPMTGHSSTVREGRRMKIAGCVHLFVGEACIEGIKSDGGKLIKVGERGGRNLKKILFADFKNQNTALYYQKRYFSLAL